MKVTTVVGAGCIGVLVFIILASKTGGLTFEGNLNKPTEVGGSMTKPPQPPINPAYSNSDDQSSPPSCPPVAVHLPPNITTVIVGNSPALIIDTEGKDSFTLTDCVDLNKISIELCDDKNKCTEGEFANGAMQTKPAS